MPRLLPGRKRFAICTSNFEFRNCPQMSLRHKGLSNRFYFIFPYISEIPRRATTQHVCNAFSLRLYVLRRRYGFVGHGFSSSRINWLSNSANIFSSSALTSCRDGMRGHECALSVWHGPEPPGRLLSETPSSLAVARTKARRGLSGRQRRKPARGRRLGKGSIMSDIGIDRWKVLRDAREEGRLEDRELRSLPKGHFGCYAVLESIS